MFSALIKSENKTIYSFDFESANEIRDKYKKGDLVCPFCEGSVWPRQGQKYTLHFYHLSDECTTKMGHHPESFEHLLGKMLLFRQLKQSISKYSNVECFMEYRLPEAGENGRIADVTAVFPSGFIQVFECQLASITVEQLEQRTKDYARIGADVTWFLGKNADTPQNQEWCIKEFGQCYHLQFTIQDNTEIDIEEQSCFIDDEEF